MCILLFAVVEDATSSSFLELMVTFKTAAAARAVANINSSDVCLNRLRSGSINESDTIKASNKKHV
jgi:hypothetical protein